MNQERVNEEDGNVPVPDFLGYDENERSERYEDADGLSCQTDP
jgi:hypothetical protein